MHDPKFPMFCVVSVDEFDDGSTWLANFQDAHNAVYFAAVWATGNNDFAYIHMLKNAKGEVMHSVAVGGGDAAPPALLDELIAELEAKAR